MLKTADTTEKSFAKRFVTRSLIFGTILGFFLIFMDVFLLNTLNSAYPKKQVFEHFETIATRIVEEKSTDFLKEPDGSEMLKSYTETRNFAERMITVKLYGFHNEELTLVVSDDFTLKSISRANDSFGFLFAVIFAYFLVYFLLGLAIAFAFNGLIYCISKHFKKNKKSKKNGKKNQEVETEFEDYDLEEYDPEEENYCPEDYDEM